MQFLDNYRYLKGTNEVNRVFSASCAIMLDKSTVLCWNMLLCCMYFLKKIIIIMVNGKRKNDIKRNTTTMYESEVKNLMTAQVKRMVSR